MNDHSHYEELAALAAGGHLSGEEHRELGDHIVTCPQCKRIEEEFSDLVRTGLPVDRSYLLDWADKTRTRPDPAMRKRFLERAKEEGVRFSLNVTKLDSPRRLHFLYPALGGAVLAAVSLLAVFYVWQISDRTATPVRAQQELDRIKHENANLAALLAEREQQVATQKGEILSLRNQLTNTNRAVESHRHGTEAVGVQLGQSTSREASLTDELQNREKQLAAANDEIARINQLRTADQASLVAQQIRINEISDQLRIANATLDMERQLTAAGRDIRELMVSRQLHVIDVRDTDVNGKPAQAFARVFLTEGKSLTFFAFDLNEAKLARSKARFQVWGEHLGDTKSLRKLGLLYVDDKAQRRWALNIINPELLHDIDSVFVTIAPEGGGNQPTGQRLLYAYLGEPNHP